MVDVWNESKTYSWIQREKTVFIFYHHFTRSGWRMTKLAKVRNDTFVCNLVPIFSQPLLGIQMKFSHYFGPTLSEKLFCIPSCYYLDQNKEPFLKYVLYSLPLNMQTLRLWTNTTCPIAVVQGEDKAMANFWLCKQMLLILFVPHPELLCEGNVQILNLNIYK